MVIIGRVGRFGAGSVIILSLGVFAHRLGLCVNLCGCLCHAFLETMVVWLCSYYVHVGVTVFIGLGRVWS